MYTRIVYLHVISAFAFVMLHGASAVASFKLRRERELARVRALLDLSSAYWNATYGSLLLMLVAGIVAGIIRSWWGQGWIWASLGLLLAMSAALYALGAPLQPPAGGRRPGLDGRPAGASPGGSRPA